MVDWICHPETGRLVITLSSPDLLRWPHRLGCKVTKECVSMFTSIFNHEAMSKGLVGNIVSKSDIMGTVYDITTLITLSDKVLRNSTSRIILRHVKVQRITA